MTNIEFLKKHFKAKVDISKRTNLEAIVSPAPEFHDTCLLIEGKIFYINLTRRLINGRRLPFY